MANKPTFEELEVFIGIVEAGSITAAADTMGISSSSLSRILYRLETRLGVTLLRRTTRRIDITPEGEEYFKRARVILEQLADADIAVKTNEKGASGLLRIDSASPFIFHQVVPILNEFIEQNPNVRIEIFNNERTIDLIEKRIDLAIRIGNLENSSLNAMSLGKSRRRVVASPAYLKKYGVPKNIEDLKNHRLVGFTDPKHLNLWSLKVKGQDQYVAKPSISASNGETIFQLVEQGVGIACLADFLTNESRKKGRLVEVLEQCSFEDKEDIHGVYYRDLQGSKTLRLFLQFLKAKLKDKL